MSGRITSYNVCYTKLLRTSEERAELTAERSTLEEAQRQLARLEPLAAKGAASATALGESRLAVQTAKARIEAIKARIELRRIVPPLR